jgi:tetratricopeptide (TPR) repeat protein
MRTLVARIEYLAAFAVASAITIFLVRPAAAQDNGGAPVGNSPSAAAASPVAGGSPVPAAADASSKVPGQGPAAGQGDSAATTATGLDYLYNKKPTDGSAAGQAADINAEMVQRARAADALNYGKLADPQLRKRFDKYLTTSEVAPATLAAYAAEMQRVSDLLLANRTIDAWKELFVLARFDTVDAGVSRELANRIESIWNNGRASDHLDQNNARLANDIKQSNRNADLMSERIRQQDIIYGREAGQGGHGKTASARSAPNGGVPMANSPGDDGGAPATASVAGLEGRLELTQEYLDALGARARIKLNELKAEKLIDKAKADFAGYIKTLSTTGRYQHVVLAADFYRKIFDEDNYPVDIANQVNASLEMARDVRNSVEVFRYDVSKNQIAAATERLQEAFSASELNPAVLGLERSLKEKSTDYLTRLDKMENRIEARDFGSLESLVQETSHVAADFDSTKPLALVNAVKLESKLHLGKAKLAAQGGDMKDAMEEFESAAKAWPGNPDLQDSSNAFFQTADVKNQSVTEFDRLVGENNYRAIFEKQLAFAPAIHGDSKRETAFADALLKIKNAEMASEKANAMRNAGDVCGAWETVELASKDLPGDNKLNSLRADLSGKAAEFVAAVNNAQDAETRSDLGYSLSWYAVAQHYYPPSSIANDGIARITKSILSPKGS